MGPVDVVAAAAGSADVCGGGGLNSDSLKREKESCYKTVTACLNKRLGFCLLGGNFFSYKRGQPISFHIHYSTFA